MAKKKQEPADQDRELNVHVRLASGIYREMTPEEAAALSDAEKWSD